MALIEDIKDFIPYITEERYQKMQEILNQRTRYITMVMENLYDPHNISAVIRTSEAFGLQNLHVIELDHKYHTSRRVCRGSDHWVNLYKYKNQQAAVDNLHKQGYKVYFADPRPDYPALDELPLDHKLALVMGQEKRGISPEMKEIADGGFRLPLYGFVESFNVSVASALTISNLVWRLRKNPPKGFFLSDEEKEKQMVHWIARNTLAANALMKNGMQGKYLLKEEFLI